METPRLATPRLTRRSIAAVPLVDDAFIAREQAVADVFAGLHIIPNRVDVRVIVWTPPMPPTGRG